MKPKRILDFCYLGSAWWYRAKFLERKHIHMAVMWLWRKNHECLGSLSPLSCFEHVISQSPLTIPDPSWNDDLWLWDVVNFQILERLKNGSKCRVLDSQNSEKKTGKALYTFKFTNFEFQTFETTSYSRVSRIFFRPLKIGNLGAHVSNFGGDLALWKEVLFWLVCCLFLFYCVYLWFLFYSLLVLVSDFVFYLGIFGVHIVSSMKQGVCWNDWNFMKLL